MFSRLYLKRKLQKNSSEYLCVFIIMIISSLLIGIPGVFLDSINRGERLRVEEETGGYDVVLVGAKESDEAYFDEVEGITSVYDSKNSSIRIKIDENVDRDYTVNHISYIVNTKSLDIDVYSYAYEAAAPRELAFLISIVQIVFTAVGMLSIYFAYSLLIEHRRTELTYLIKLGIERKTLRNTLLCELAVLFVPAVGISSALAAVIVKGVISAFFVKSDYYVRMVYDFSFRSLVLLLINSAAALLVSFALAWKKLTKGVSGEYYEAEKHGHRYLYKSTSRTTPVSFITRVMLLRERKYSAPCSVIAIITVAVVTFVVLYSGAVSADYGESDITITVSSAQLYDRADEVESAFDKLKEMPYFSSADYERDYNGYVAELDTVRSVYETYAIVDNVRYSYISLTAVDTEIGENDALVPAGTDMSIFKGGELRLRDMLNISGGDAGILNIVGTYGEAHDGGFLNVYVSPETFTALTGHEPVTRAASLRLSPDYGTDEVTSALEKIFADKTLYSIFDNSKIRAEQRSNDRIIKVLMAAVDAMIMTCGAILVYVFTSLEAIRNKTYVEKLIRIGADERCVVIPVVLASLMKCTAAYIVGITLSGALSFATAYFSGARLNLGMLVLATYVLLFFIEAILFIIPAWRPTKKLMKERA